MSYHFQPDPARGRALDRGMHRELGLSLEHVCAASGGVIPFDAAALSGLSDRLKNGGPVAPATFARYYDLVTAIQDDDLDAAARLFAELAGAGPGPADMTVHDLGAPTLGAESERYIRMMNGDDTLELGFLPPEPDIATSFRTRLADGFALLDAEIPDLAGEVRAIIREVVIVGSDKTAKYQFDGGSHYQLWGALFLNGNFHPDRVAVAEVLAHESAHSLLFGFCTHEPLVLNDDDDLYASPLRADPRPMDGIYHATFVSARMHWAMTRLAESPRLTAEERDRARAAAAADVTNFRAGHGVVAEHGVLTGVGAGLMDAAKAYMDSVD